ncbi:MAG: cobalt transporter [Fusicatenibacter sp.]|nr:cobalt transporter [Fusicatenibacter sp.]
MHLLYDENGNPIPHGTHEHEHTHEHHCENSCGSCEGSTCKDENLALLTYMLQHNEHHAAELDEMADKLEKSGMADAARQIREGVSDFQKGNMRLSLALTLVKEHLKEA